MTGCPTLVSSAIEKHRSFDCAQKLKDGAPDWTTEPERISCLRLGWDEGMRRISLLHHWPIPSIENDHDGVENLIRIRAAT
jgi:hypothetical protein